MTRISLRTTFAVLSLLPFACLPGCPAPGGGADTDGDGLVDGTIIPFDPLNRSPVAALSVAPAAGVGPGAGVTLDASGSSDPDNDPLTFTWSQTGGDAVALSDPGAATVTFVTPFVVNSTELGFRLVVRDNRGGEATAFATVTVSVGGGDYAGNPQSVAQYRDTLSSDEAYHLLRRAAFGAKPEQVQAAVQRGLTATVDDLLTLKNEPDWVNILAEEYEENVDDRWMLYLLEGNNPLYERMALFWHDRFAASSRVLEGRDRMLSVLHWHMLRGNCLGNYREFLKQLTLDPLMLIWLDGANSPKQSPNENYTREFWELFTLGRDVLYTEADIREGARAFTGITLLRQSNQNARPIYDLLNHDETPKLIFPDRTNNTPVNYNFEGVIDLTLAQPEAARYVARNLFTLFVHDHPSDATVQELADFFRSSNWELKPLVRRILLSQALFSSEARGNQVASPVEHLVGVSRTLDMHMYSEDSQGYTFDALLIYVADAGQQMLNPPGVEGWKEDTGWLKDQWMIQRVNAFSRTMEYGPNFTPRLPYHLLPAVERWNQREVRGEIVDALAAVFHLPLTEMERDIYIEVLDQNGWQAFHLGDPRYQWQHVYELIRLMAMDERVIGR